MASPIRVDIDGLSSLATRLRAIRQQLENLGYDFGRFDREIGAPVVRARLGEVAGNWTAARQRIGRELTRLADMADTAASTYQAKEDEISRAASGPVAGN